MEKHKCMDCIYHDTDSMFTGEDDVMWCYCELHHEETHDKCDCNPYDIESGNPVECEDFKPYPQ